MQTITSATDISSDDKSSSAHHHGAPFLNYKRSKPMLAWMSMNALFLSGGATSTLLYYDPAQHKNSPHFKHYTKMLNISEIVLMLATVSCVAQLIFLKCLVCRKSMPRSGAPHVTTPLISLSTVESGVNSRLSN